MIYPVIFILSAGCGYLYRMGGDKKFNTLYRDLGSPAIMILSLILLHGVHSLKEAGSLLLSFLISWGSISTYRYFLKKPENYTWPYYALHGFFVALSILPWAIVTGEWKFLIARAVICGALVSAWSGIIRWDVLEEVGRGFIMNITMLMIRIPVL